MNKRNKIYIGIGGILLLIILLSLLYIYTTLKILPDTTFHFLGKFSDISKNYIYTVNYVEDWEGNFIQIKVENNKLTKSKKNIRYFNYDFFNKIKKVEILTQDTVLLTIYSGNLSIKDSTIILLEGFAYYYDVNKKILYKEQFFIGK